MDYSEKRVKVVFSWEGYPKQGAQGMIGNLLMKNQIVPIDCDASVIISSKLTQHGSERCADIIDCHNTTAFNYAIHHEGDNISTGTNDETIIIDFPKLSENVIELKLTLDTYKSENLKKNSFGKTHYQLVRIIDLTNGDETGCYNYIGIPTTGILHCGSFKKEPDGTWIFVNYGKATTGISCKEDSFSFGRVSE